MQFLAVAGDVTVLRPSSCVGPVEAFIAGSKDWQKVLRSKEPVSFTLGEIYHSPCATALDKCRHCSQCDYR